MDCYNSPSYYYYNNGPWENSGGCDSNHMVQPTRTARQVSNVSCPEDVCTKFIIMFPSIITVDALPAVGQSSSSNASTWSGCIDISLIPNNIQLKYIPNDEISYSTQEVQDIYQLSSSPLANRPEPHTQFNVINPISYTNYNSCSLTDISLDINLGSVTSSLTSPPIDITFKPKNVIMSLPFNQSRATQKLLLDGSSSITATDCLYPVNYSEVVVQYNYIGFCNNITLTILDISINIGDPPGIQLYPSCDN